MKTLQKGALGALALGIGAIVAFNHPLIAQPGPGDGEPGGLRDGRPDKDRPPHARGPSAEQMTRMLDLTPEQEQKVKAILDKTRVEMRRLREASRQQIDAVLTPVQRAKLEEFRAPHGPPGGPPPHGPDGPRGGRPPRPRGPSVEELTERLDLTLEQQGKIKVILDKTRERAEAVHEDETLSRAQRRAAMRSLREDTRGQVEALLTPQQLEKMKQFHEQHGPPGGPPPHGPPGGPPPHGPYGRRPPSPDGV